MKIFVTGGTGLLGTKLIELGKKEFEMFSSVRSPVESRNYKFIQLDIRERNKVFDALERIKPNVVFHTAALTDVDYCETRQKEAWDINVNGTRNIADTCQKNNIKMVYISTDYIFDGINGPYTENDTPNPINFYGRTKLEGENIVKELKDFLIIRSTILYGLHKKENFLTWVIKMLKENKKINVVNDQYGTPTLADNCVEALLSLFKENKTGIYNVSGKDLMNRFNFALEIAEEFGLDKNLINPVSTKALKQSARRPMRAGLIVDKIEGDLNIKMLKIKEALDIVKSQACF
jgi:dTDP-4-dehydrorhamnose reductase